MLFMDMITKKREVTILKVKSLLENWGYLKAIPFQLKFQN